MLVQDRHIRVINAGTRELLRELTLDSMATRPRLGQVMGKEVEFTARAAQHRAMPRNTELALSFVTGGQWLATAMQAAWEGAAAVLDVDGLADVLGERHRIMSNDWLAAHMRQSLIGHDAGPHRGDARAHRFHPGRAARADLTGARVTPRRCTRWPR